jgi:hypothetical protein
MRNGYLEGVDAITLVVQIIHQMHGGWFVLSASERNEASRTLSSNANFAHKHPLHSLAKMSAQVERTVASPAAEILPESSQSVIGICDKTTVISVLQGLFCKAPRARKAKFITKILHISSR